MPVEFLRYLFNLGLVTFVALMLVFFLIFIAHILMPKRLLTTYFKMPYFREGEIMMFTGFPFGYIRTVMFMRLLANPSSGAKRGLTRAFELAPLWFRLYSKLTLLLFYAVAGLFMLIMLIFMLEFFVLNPESN
jgi:hypothetical protein